MVLSNKKLKQKLRSDLVESLTAKESEIQGNDAGKPESNLQQPHSLKELLGSVTQKPRLTKREIRRKKISLEKPTTSEKDTNTQKENDEIGLMGSSNNKAKKKNKKRKRTDGPEEEIGDGDNESTADKSENGVKKEKDKNKKKENKKKKTKKEKKKKGAENKEGESKVEGRPVELMKTEESEENGSLPTKVYVGGIPYYSTEDDIRSFFENCGTITEVDCMKFPESGKFRGIAMITFKTKAATKRALALDGADMGGLFLKIQPYKTTRAHKSSDFTPELVDGYNRIYVGNLSWDITEDDLKKLFTDCNISSIRFGMDKTTGEFRGYAHVDFHDSLSLAMALKLDQKEVCGRPVRIRCAVPKKEAETRSGSESSAGKDAENGASFGRAKKKRQTCYECGVPGHISRSCPKKQAVNVENSNVGS
eukprot:TRINITY_DN1466_c1_g1_i1.p1 TRINITY_DN1466_c1_g1~~TRINITY_DN1466_c1_g1_i1.p1  ORF type:complete len:444 (-),score=136.90 TRINITY_DN1466_c1_g1_i1:461-1726(-)